MPPSTRPNGELTLRTLAMPGDANAAGDIFGGWVMAQTDLSCGIRAAERVWGRVVTAAAKQMAFSNLTNIGIKFANPQTHDDFTNERRADKRVVLWIADVIRRMVFQLHITV